VHGGERAARPNAGLGAEAFTVGRDIVLGGPLDLADRTGLLAHELAHVAQLDGRDGLVLRQGRPGAETTGVATTDDRRDFVQSTIRFLESASDYDAQMTARPPIERILRQWQQMVETQGHMVINDLNANPALYRSLRAAYRHAPTTLIETAARLTNRPVTALYEQHRSLIPEWAFPTQRVAGITADLPIEAQVDRRGRASLPVGQVNVIVLPDRRNDARRAETTIQFSPFRIGFRARGGSVTSFTGTGRHDSDGVRPRAPRRRAIGVWARDHA
jgi:hypothetical protein